MRNLEIPVPILQALRARAALNSSEEVSWPGTTIIQRAPDYQDEEIDCTYHAKYYRGWVSISVSVSNLDTSAVIFKQDNDWGEIL